MVAVRNPHHRPSFFGRRSELEALSSRLSQGDRLVTIAGIGGIGKTRLAIELAASFAGEHVFVELSEARTRSRLLDALARAAGATVQRSNVETVGRGLASRGPLLVILDNFEQLISEAALLAELLVAAPDVRFLVTSREQLRLSMEVVLELQPLDVTDLSQGCFAVGLFVDRMRKRQVDFAPTEAELATIFTVVRALDGIPLALELAADRAMLLGLDAVASSVDDRRHLSACGPRDAPDRHRTMQRALEGSWHALDDAERDVLTAASVFRGGFAARDLVAVCGAAATVLDSLEGLRVKSLVRCGASTPSTRLRLLGVIRDFVLDGADAAVVAGMRERHAAHFAAQLRRMQKGTADGGAAFIADEWDNLEAAFEHLVLRAEDALGPASLLLLGVGETALRGGHVGWLRERVYDLIARAAGLELHVVVQLWLLRARAEWSAGELAVARASFDEARRLADASGDNALAARALRVHSFYLARSGKLDEARAVFERASLLQDPAEDVGGGAHDVLGLSSALRQGREVARARVLLESHLRTATDACDRALALMELAATHFEAGAYDLMIGTARECLATFRRSGWRAEEARALLFIALGHYLRGDLVPAEARFRELIACAAETDHASSAEYARGYLGVLFLETGRTAEADAALRDASPPDGGHIALFASYRASALAQGGDLLQARAVAVDLDRADVPPCLQPAVALSAVHLRLAEAREAAALEDTSRATAAYGHAAAVAAAAEGLEGDTRLALRVARRALDQHALPGRREVIVETLSVHESGAWFCLGSGPRVSYARFANRRKALRCLVEAWLAAPGKTMSWQALVARIWAGESVRESAVKNRLRVEIALLRKDGLRDLLVTDATGYRFSESVLLRIVRDASAPRSRPRVPGAPGSNPHLN